MTLKLQVDSEAEIAEFMRCIAPWPEARLADFVARWNELEAVGAELVTLEVRGAAVIAMSEDFRRLAAEFGVRL